MYRRKMKAESSMAGEGVTETILLLAIQIDSWCFPRHASVPMPLVHQALHRLWSGRCRKNSLEITLCHPPENQSQEGSSLPLHFLSSLVELSFQPSKLTCSQLSKVTRTFRGPGKRVREEPITTTTKDSPRSANLTQPKAHQFLLLLQEDLDDPCNWPSPEGKRRQREAAPLGREQMNGAGHVLAVVAQKGGGRWSRPWEAAITSLVLLVLLPSSQQQPPQRFLACSSQLPRSPSPPPRFTRPGQNSPPASHPDSHSVMQASFWALRWLL